jgi:hypothetical protein
MHQLAQLVVGRLGVLECLADQRRRVLLTLVERAAGQLQRDDRVHQSLPRAVVEVSHHPPPGLVRLGDQTRPRAGELITSGPVALSA